MCEECSFLVACTNTYNIPPSLTGLFLPRCLEVNCIPANANVVQHFPHLSSWDLQHLPILQHSIHYIRFYQQAMIIAIVSPWFKLACKSHQSANVIFPLLHPEMIFLELEITPLSSENISEVLSIALDRAYILLSCPAFVPILAKSTLEIVHFGIKGGFHRDVISSKCSPFSL